MGEDRRDDELVPTNQALTTYLEQVRAKYEKQGAGDLEREAKASAREVHEKIAPGGKFPPEQQWLPFAPMPTDMCRVSPFFPMNRSQLRDREVIIKGMVITESSWGKIIYTGPRLTTYDEDVLLAVLALIDSQKKKDVVEVEGKSTYTYKGPLLPIAKLMKVSKGGAQYKRIVQSLELMAMAVVRLVTKEKNWEIDNMLTHAKWDNKAQTLTVVVNPYFFEKYMAKSVTLLDVMLRADISSSLGKCLYRFMQSHRDDEWRGHYLTLAAALNIDINMPPRRIRQAIRRAVQALADKGHLKKDSGFTNMDIVVLHRSTPKILPENPQLD